MKGEHNLVDFFGYLAGSKYEQPTCRLIEFLTNEESCVGCVWAGSGARYRDRRGDIDLLVFCRPQAEVVRLLKYCETGLRNSGEDVFQRIPFLPQMGSLISVYYAPDYIDAIDLGVVGEDWWPLIRLEPFARILWQRSGFPQVTIGRDLAIERAFSTEFWISMWKVRKAASRMNYMRALEYLNRARRAVLGEYVESRGEFCYPDRPEHYQELFSASELDVLVEGFFQPETLSGVIRSSVALIEVGRSFFSLSPVELKGLLAIENGLKTLEEML